MSRKAKAPKPPKKVKEPDKIWPVCVESWFLFFKDKFGKDPTFIGHAASSYKKLVGLIKKQTTDAGFEWNELSAKENMNAFFETAYNHTDLYFQNRIRQNFTLPNLLFNVDKILIFNGKQAGSQNHFQRFANTVRDASQRISDSNQDGR